MGKEFEILIESESVLKCMTDGHLGIIIKLYNVMIIVVGTIIFKDYLSRGIPCCEAV
jgi:hypothetical protein